MVDTESTKGGVDDVSGVPSTKIILRRVVVKLAHLSRSLIPNPQNSTEHFRLAITTLVAEKEEYILHCLPLFTPRCSIFSNFNTLLGRASTTWRGKRVQTFNFLETVSRLS